MSLTYLMIMKRKKARTGKKVSFIKQLNEKLDKRLSDYLEANPCKSSSRQSKATKRGTLVEDVVREEYLLTNKNVDRVETQVFASEIDEFSNIDLVAHLFNGEVVYIPCARDLWLGTTQQDRLQLVYYKHKLWQTGKALPQNVHVCYLCSEDYNDYLNQKTMNHARRKKKLQQTVKYLADSNILHNIDTLMSYINKLGTK